MLRVCCYQGCGSVYGEKEPLSDKRMTHGLCEKHFKISMQEIEGKKEKNSRVSANEARPRIGFAY